MVVTCREKDAKDFTEQQHPVSEESAREGTAYTEFKRYSKMTVEPQSEAYTK